ncbi:MAG: Protein kinase, partial [Myxococcaceae bacterium]|nr:Protein kinase [Myxococcaceae bacterium]
MDIEPADRRDETPAGRVGRYELLAPLGRGGMATVHLVRSVGSAGFERLAAMKILHRELSADQEFVEMFLDEARLAARLHHPNAAAILDLGADGPQPFMVMDYVEGDTLYAVQAAASSLHRTIPVGVALRIILDALAGLDAAHELRGIDGAPLGLIHRDVSPLNVLVGVDGVARLVDFGIARAASRRGVTAVGMVKGNLPFMSPEQLRGLAVDRRSDVYSMGVTLWETLTLRRCLPMREGAAISRLAREDYRPLAEVAPKLPASLDAICRQALAFDPDERFPTAAAFAAAIEGAFRHDVATQRELAQFMSVVAATKVKREREAVRASAQPMPDRSAIVLANATKATADHRGRFAPVPAPGTLAGAFFDPEAPTVLSPWQRRMRRAGGAIRSWAQPSPSQPSRFTTWRFGAPPPAPKGRGGRSYPPSGSLYEAVTEALFHRRRAALASLPPPPEPVTVKLAAVAPWPDSFATSL